MTEPTRAAEEVHSLGAALHRQGSTATGAADDQLQVLSAARKKSHQASAKSVGQPKYAACLREKRWSTIRDAAQPGQVTTSPMALR